MRFTYAPLKRVQVLFFLQEVKRLGVKLASHLDLRQSVRTDGATCMPLLYIFIARRGATLLRIESVLIAPKYLPGTL